MRPKIYFESKKVMYVTVLVLLVILLASYLLTDPSSRSIFGYLGAIVGFMVVGVFSYPAAKISIFDDHLEFRKGFQKISVPWKEVLGIHKDPVFAKDIFSYYIAKKYPMGGVFLETSKGFTKYFAPQLIRSKGTQLMWKDLLKDIQDHTSAQVQEGAVSMFKQRSKLFDVVFLLLAVFAAPIIIILLYGVFSGTFGDSLTTVSDLFNLFTDR